MKSVHALRRLAGLTALCSTLALPLVGQNLLYTKYDGKMHMVRRALEDRPFIEVAGKLTGVNGKSYALVKADEYLPLTINLTNVEVSNRAAQVDLARMRTDFRFRAIFEAPYDLKNVFVVIELKAKPAGQLLFLQDLNELSAHVPKQFILTIPLSDELDAKDYKLHVFVDGREALNSTMPAGERDGILDAMTAKRIAGAKDSGPKMFAGPPPEYPASLRKSGQTGKVVLGIRIGADGRVHEPTVKSASDPAFGEAALAAVKFWRFLPRIKEGKPVDTPVDLPLDFPPPKS